MNLAAGPGVAVREFRMAPRHGFADYMLFVGGEAADVLDAKPVGYTLSSVELQVDKYASGLPDGLNPPVTPLPFQCVSTGVETRFTNGLDPDPKSRRILAPAPHTRRWPSGCGPRRSMPGRSACMRRTAASIRGPGTRARRRCARACGRCRARAGLPLSGAGRGGGERRTVTQGQPPQLCARRRGRWRPFDGAGDASGVAVHRSSRLQTRRRGPRNGPSESQGRQHPASSPITERQAVNPPGAR